MINVEELKEMYPVGTRIELLHMEDVQAPPSGTRGTVFYIDCIGTIHMTWDNGSSLGLIHGKDIFKVIK